jgi:Fe-S-cluster-containing dehydrogenase component/DMSO reductase anchor subunit
VSLLFEQPKSIAARPAPGAATGGELSRTLIDDLLADQQQLTAIERFARLHEHSEFPAQARYYRDLLPLDKPRPGEQYAFAVDLDACTGCKACVSACHSLNGLDDDEIWRNVGLLHGGTEAEPYQQIVTTACHHCVDPACLNGCPVLAYEKDADTGIVRHLDDQCIGCQYCVLKCPYDVPKYSARRGIVRKCDLCHGRLAAGEAPACVQACPSGAISIRLVAKSDLEQICGAPGAQMLPGAFESAYTKPTTVYTSRKSIPANARSAFSNSARPEPAHWALVWMLVLTQTATGLSLSGWLISMFKPQVFASGRVAIATISFALLLTGLAASIFHLGRPLGAWRAFLGFRRSWMSREIVALGFFAVAAGASVAFRSPSLTAATAVLGLLSVFCSAMIYIDTRRPSWVAPLTFPSFFGTTLLLGSAAAACVLNSLALNGIPEIRSAAHFAVWSPMVVQTALFSWKTQNRLRPRNPTRPVDDFNLFNSFNPFNLFNIFFTVSTLSGLLAIFTSGRIALCFVFLSFASTLTSQIIERYVFFTTSNAPRMPGTAAQ